MAPSSTDRKFLLVPRRSPHLLAACPVRSRALAAARQKLGEPTAHGQESIRPSSRSPHCYRPGRGHLLAELTTEADTPSSLGQQRDEMGFPSRI